MTINTPPPCSGSVMVSFPTSSLDKVVLLNSGGNPVYSTYINNTWTFNSSLNFWTNHSAALIDPNGPLPARNQQVMAYDGTHIVLFSGKGSSVGQLFSDTWTYDGYVWTERTPATSPPGRTLSVATYLSGTGTVMFGGADQGSVLYRNDTWIWSGTTWTQSTPTTSPSARINHAFAAGSSYALLFGGSISNGAFLNDTWKFDGTNWTQLFPATVPSVRGKCSLSYDSVNNVWVLFGGVNQYNYLDETWIFNGTNWTKVAVAGNTMPVAKYYAQMCFDTVGGNTILFGGISADTNQPSSHTWSFNGSTFIWTKL
jgi:hypothetical protein